MWLNFGLENIFKKHFRKILGKHFVKCFFKMLKCLVNFWSGKHF